MGAGTVAVRWPRVRGLNERFESTVLPLFKRKSRKIENTLPELYLHGPAEGDFDLEMRGLLGDDAPLSASSDRSSAGPLDPGPSPRVSATWVCSIESLPRRLNRR
ncbi:MAG: hypothetical protein HY682_02725 [Chloroflexi bacterium]|nr:hypothetical protein [Chloroflexota bacterium]